MKRWGVFSVSVTAAAVTAGIVAGAWVARAQGPPSAPGANPPQAVEFYGAGGGPIAGGVVVPAGRAYLWTSGTVPSPADPAASAGSAERYGDTKTQAVSILKKFEAQLKEKGLSLRDVVYLRAYVVPDPRKGGKPDFRGWFDAYGEYFANERNPTRVARSTVAVSGLVDPDWLIEIEAVAVYPAAAAVPGSSRPTGSAAPPR